MNIQQLELTLNKSNACRSLTRRQLRLQRAHQWFERMRQVVERATDWRPTPPPRPEQSWFPTAGFTRSLANSVPSTPQPHPEHHLTE